MHDSRQKEYDITHTTTQFSLCFFASQRILDRTHTHKATQDIMTLTKNQKDATYTSYKPMAKESSKSQRKSGRREQREKAKATVKLTTAAKKLNGPQRCPKKWPNVASVRPTIKQRRRRRSKTSHQHLFSFYQSCLLPVPLFLAPEVALSPLISSLFPTHLYMM